MAHSTPYSHPFRNNTLGSDGRKKLGVIAKYSSQASLQAALAPLGRILLLLGFETLTLGLEALFFEAGLIATLHR